ncbi:MAG: hypothetical protein K6T81_20840 [Alicyclobacillus macrosporangiidus]|uniref:hypothetical protein n=1 Tax=Alicyclobacillus macrosporangiidus TaxID=392015 RepID=UPI0026E9CB8C|nr:hypothetical protein [Alicyclobacillus macrosporangiidus]MCL6601156.1 hypothetical protein [Alicyclobacillus macrosporangiidus]
MQVVNSAALGAAFRPLERNFSLMVLIMLATGFTAAIVARLVFFWAPRKVRGEVSGSAAGIGVLLGIGLGLKILHL